tara:strand:- start:1665 stop:1907 length:243 start_codon:yes stop_codon:yes gene_type:complete
MKDNIQIAEIIFRKHLNLKKNYKIQKLKYGQQQWDSIIHMAIIAELEKKMKTTFDIDDVISMNSFEKVIKILKKYNKKNA